MALRVKNDRRPFNPFQDQPFAAAQEEYVDSREAVVVDVIVNDNHPEYSMDGYNVGAIKFRLLQDNVYRHEHTLHWAFPLESNFTDYPLLHEVVEIYSYLGRFYYSNKINVTSRVTAQPVFGINEELSPPVSPDDAATNRRNAQGNPIKQSKFSLGASFTDDGGVYRLRNDEGDIILEGRSGQSIRFGSSRTENGVFPSENSEQAPNMLFRVGPSQENLPTIKFGLVQEDIDFDLTSLWLTSDQIIPLTVATSENSDVNYVSNQNPPDSFSGAQIVANTGQFIVNTKQGPIMGFGATAINWETNGDYTVDVGDTYRSSIVNDNLITAGGDYLSVSGGNTSLRANKIHLGSLDNEDEPIPLGSTLTKLLIALCDAHLNNISDHVDTAVGPGILAPAVATALQQIKSQLVQRTILSNDNFVTKTNE